MSLSITINKKRKTMQALFFFCKEYTKYIRLQNNVMQASHYPIYTTYKYIVFL